MKGALLKMSAQFSFHLPYLHERSQRLVKRFQARARLTHSIVEDELFELDYFKLNLRRHTNGQPQLDPHQGTYRHHYQIAWGTKDICVRLSTCTFDDLVTPEAILHPVVDIFVQVLLEVRVKKIGFEAVEAIRRPSEIVPCSEQTLRRLLSRDSKVVYIEWDKVRIARELISAFAGHQVFQGQCNKSLKLRFDHCSIEDYSLLGQSLGNNPFLRDLVVVETKDHANAITSMVSELASRPTKLKLLHLRDFWELNVEQAHQLFQSILNIPLNKLYVHQDGGVLDYAFHGLWSMLARHSTISHFSYIAPFHWCRQPEEIQAIRNAPFENPNIVVVDGAYPSLGGWHWLDDRVLASLLERNRRHWQVQDEIEEFVKLPPSKTRREEWISLLAKKNDSVSCLYQILIGTVGSANLNVFSY